MKRPACATFLILFLAALTIAAEPPQGWLELGLEPRPVEAATLYLDPKLAEHASEFERAVAQFVQSRRIREEQLGRIDASVEVKLRQVLGVQSDEKAAETLAQTLAITRDLGQRWIAPPEKLRFYVTVKSTVQDYLARGGRLDSVVIDPQTGGPVLQLGWKVKKKAGEALVGDPLEHIPVPIQEQSQVPPGEQFRQFLGGLEKLSSIGPGILLHEAVEMVLLHQLADSRYTDPCIRWFTDGFATAVAAHMLREIGMPDEARSIFAVWGRPEEYDDIRGQVNLRWWLNLSYTVYDSVRAAEYQTPAAGDADSFFEREARLSNARYLFSAIEAQRLIDEHGIDCVKAILGSIRQEQRISSDRLIRIVHEVTGEDIEARLRAYQSFASREDGDAPHSDAYVVARRGGNAGEALYQLLRVMELRLGTGDAPAAFYGQAAELLIELKQPRVAIHLIETAAQACQQRRAEPAASQLQAYLQELRSRFPSAAAPAR